MVLDSTLDMTDQGRSAFNRNAESFGTCPLGRFVERVKGGKIEWSA